MSELRRRSFFLGGIATTGSMALASFAKSEPEQQFFFTTGEFSIRMNVEYYDDSPNPALRFEDRAANSRYCLSAKGENNRNCANDFKGSIAVARYHISPRPGKSTSSLMMREYVRSIDQSDYLPARSPFERLIEVRSGLASDIQVFGYKDDPSAEANQSDKAWCFLRQDLYLGQGGVPFLVLHWKHTVSSIRVLDIIPENGTVSVTRHS
jgi:hypothetical protein